MPPVFAWELVPYDPILVEPEHKSGCAVCLSDVLDEPFFNFDLVEYIVGSDNDESDSVVEVQQTHTIPQTTSTPA